MFAYQDALDENSPHYEFLPANQEAASLSWCLGENLLLGDNISAQPDYSAASDLDFKLQLEDVAANQTSSNYNNGEGIEPASWTSHPWCGGGYNIPSERVENAGEARLPNGAPFTHPWSHSFQTPNSIGASEYNDLAYPVSKQEDMPPVPVLATSPPRKRTSSSIASSPDDTAITNTITNTPAIAATAETTTTTATATAHKFKKRCIKQHVSRNKTAMTPEQQRLLSLLEAEGTGVYRALIPTANAAAAYDAQVMLMFAKSPVLCTNPANDDTFPRNVGDQQHYVKELFAAICDWDDYIEMDKTLGESNMEIWHQARRLPEQDPEREALMSALPSVAEQQKKILGKPLSDYVVEQLGWRLLDRVDALCDSLRKSKQLVKSVLSASWYMRIANNPVGELTHKVNNMKVNSRKNERMRLATSQQKNSGQN